MSCPGDQLHIHSSSHTSRNGFSGAVDGENDIHKVKIPGSGVVAYQANSPAIVLESIMGLGSGLG